MCESNLPVFKNDMTLSLRSKSIEGHVVRKRLQNIQINMKPIMGIIGGFFKRYVHTGIL